MIRSKTEIASLAIQGQLHLHYEMARRFGFADTLDLSGFRLDERLLDENNRYILATGLDRSGVPWGRCWFQYIRKRMISIEVRASRVQRRSLLNHLDEKENDGDGHVFARHGRADV